MKRSVNELGYYLLLVALVEDRYCFDRFYCGIKEELKIKFGNRISNYDYFSANNLDENSKNQILKKKLKEEDIEKIIQGFDSSEKEKLIVPLKTKEEIGKEFIEELLINKTSVKDNLISALWLRNQIDYFGLLSDFFPQDFRLPIGGMGLMFNSYLLLMLDDIFYYREKAERFSRKYEEILYPCENSDNSEVEKKMSKDAYIGQIIDSNYRTAYVLTQSFLMNFILDVAFHKGLYTAEDKDQGYRSNVENFFKKLCPDQALGEELKKFFDESYRNLLMHSSFQANFPEKRRGRGTGIRSKQSLFDVNRQFYRTALNLAIDRILKISDGLWQALSFSPVSKEAIFVNFDKHLLEEKAKNKLDEEMAFMKTLIWI